MKSQQFDQALKILAGVLERDGKKSRRAKPDRRALEHSSARVSIRSAAQAYIGNKELWSIGPAKVTPSRIMSEICRARMTQGVGITQPRPYPDSP